MLNTTVGWCGKLPLYSDFVQSSHLFDIQNSLIDWISNGEDHLGERFIHSDDFFSIYYFFLESSISDNKRIHGLFIKSMDSRGRVCPFIFFTHNYSMQPSELISLFEEKMKEIGLEWSEFYNPLTEALIDNIKNDLKSLDVFSMFDGNADKWIELYPNIFKSNFIVESTNHLIYRKLLVR